MALTPLHNATFSQSFINFHKMKQLHKQNTKKDPKLKLLVEDEKDNYIEATKEIEEIAVFHEVDFSGK